LVDNDDNTNVNMNNVYFFDLTDGQDFDDMPTGSVTIATLEATLQEATALTKADYFKEGSDAFTTEVALKANTVGATKSAFTSWTWSDLDGQLADFK
jgi:hypothetical protein